MAILEPAGAEGDGAAAGVDAGAGEDAAGSAATAAAAAAAAAAPAAAVGGAGGSATAMSIASEWASAAAAMTASARYDHARVVESRSQQRMVPSEWARSAPQCAAGKARKRRQSCGSASGWQSVCSSRFCSGSHSVTTSGSYATASSDPSAAKATAVAALCR